MVKMEWVVKVLSGRNANLEGVVKAVEPERCYVEFGGQWIDHRGVKMPNGYWVDLDQLIVIKESPEYILKINRLD